MKPLYLRTSPLAHLNGSTGTISVPRGEKENHAHFDVPGGSDAAIASHSSATEQTLAELRELHRDGEKATTLGLRHLDFRDGS